MLCHDCSLRLREINKQLTSAQSFLTRYNRETGQKALEYKEKTMSTAPQSPFFEIKPKCLVKLARHASRDTVVTVRVNLGSCNSQIR